MSRSAVYQLLGQYANVLWPNGRTNTFDDAALWLNGQGATTGAGTPYVIGGRGIAFVIDCAWHYFTNKGDHVTALNIAKAYTDKYGNYAY